MMSTDDVMGWHIEVAQQLMLFIACLRTTSKTVVSEYKTCASTTKNQLAAHDLACACARGNSLAHVHLRSNNFLEGEAPYG